MFQKILELKTNKEIASELHLSASSVHLYKRNIFRKAGLGTVAGHKTLDFLKQFGHFRIDMRWIPNKEIFTTE